MKTADATMPASAAWLGGLGAVPFIALAGVLPFLDVAARPAVIQALLAYGAVILSFLGGIHWGLAIARSGAADAAKLPAWLTLSVAPSLMGWAALLLAGRAGLLLLAITIAAMLVVDLRTTRLGEAPAWYPKLRIPLSIVVVVSLLAGALV